MKKISFYFVCFCSAFSLFRTVHAKDAVDYVDPFIGTGRSGSTYPGAVTPGGMVQLSPDTGNGSSGYRHRDTTIQGFSFTHMSGVGWYGDLGNFLVMPTTGELHTWYGETGHPGSGYLSRFTNSSEIAEAGYYAVTLDDYKIRAEAAAAPRSGMLRFTFPENKLSRIQIDLGRRIGGTSLKQSVKVVGDNAIEGRIECKPDGGGWGHGAGNVSYTLYFHAEFSKPLTQVGIFSAEMPDGKNYRDALGQPWFAEACRNAKVSPGQREGEGKRIGFYTEFPTKADEQVSMKVGISFVSIEGARNNLQAEIHGWDFDQVRQNVRNLWSQELGRMEVSGSSDDQKTVFYTALYHALLDPRIFGDVNGDYPGGDGKIHNSPAFTKRTIFSGWDVYRSEFPLLTIIEPNVVNDTINSFVELADQNGTGYFDRWELFNSYTACMNGSPVAIVLNDAWQKGIRNYDVKKALNQAAASIDHDLAWSLKYKRIWVLSHTMENLNASWSVYKLAASIGREDIADKYYKHSQGWRDLFDPTVPWTYDKEGKIQNPEWKGWFRGRDEQGQFLPWKGLTTFDTCQECSVYQQGWLVPYDIPGLTKALGGKDLLIAKLEDFFDRTRDIARGDPYYNQNNEPVHLIPFLFNRAGAPWLTQKWVRKITEVYKTGSDGLCGDEDVGQMSAWFVMAASGLHPACPGDPRYEIFTPLVGQVTIRLDPKYATGKTFTISTQNNSAENIYIQSAQLNGKPLNRCWITHDEIIAGGKLDLVLGSKPNMEWGIGSR